MFPRSFVPVASFGILSPDCSWKCRKVESLSSARDRRLHYIIIIRHFRYFRRTPSAQLNSLIQWPQEDVEAQKVFKVRILFRLCIYKPIQSSHSLHHARDQAYVERRACAVLCRLAQGVGHCRSGIERRIRTATRPSPVKPATATLLLARCGSMRNLCSLLPVSLSRSFSPMSRLSVAPPQHAASPRSKR